MVNKDDNISFNPARAKVIVGLIAAVLGLGGTVWAYGGSYHAQFSQQHHDHDQFATSAEIYTLAIQDKEDQLALIEFKESVGSATPEDASNKARIVRRLGDLKTKLENTR